MKKVNVWVTMFQAVKKGKWNWGIVTDGHVSCIIDNEDYDTEEDAKLAALRSVEWKGICPTYFDIIS